MNKFGSVLITGGTGFFGHGCVRALLDGKLSDRICIYSRDEYKQSLMRAEFGDDERLRFFVGDVRDLARLRRAFKGVDLVIHAAALKRVETCEYDVMEAIATNVHGAENVVDAAIEAGVKKVVFLSTDKACNPTTAYGYTKALAERIFASAKHYAGADGTLFATTRYGNVTNSTGSVIPTWLKMIANGAKSLPVTDPNCTRFHMTRDEAVRLVLHTARTMKGGEVAVPNLPAYRLGDLAQAMGMPLRVIGLPEGQKKHEEMTPGSSSEHARRMTIGELKEVIGHA